MLGLDAIYGRPDFNGMAADSAPPGSMPYAEFLKAVKDKRVEGVVFQPPDGRRGVCDD